MKHGDTTLWWWQVVTGFAMFFLASIHLHAMLTRSERNRSVGERRPDLVPARLGALPGAAVRGLALGLATLAAYIKIGIAQGPRAAEPYTPAWAERALPAPK